MLINDAVRSYVEQLACNGRAGHTLKQATRHLALFAHFIGNRAVARITHEDTARFLVSALACRTADGRVKRASTMNALRSTIRSFGAYAHAAGLAPSDFARLVRRARCPAPPPRFLMDTEVAALLGALEGARTVAERRDKALVMLLLKVGLRVGSVVGLDVGDMNLDTRELRVRKLKNGGEATLFIPKDLVPLLREYVATRTRGHLFVGTAGKALSARQAHRRVSDWARRAGIARSVGPHALRHVFGQRLFKATGNVILVAKAMCHRSITSSQTYVHADGEMLRKALGA